MVKLFQLGVDLHHANVGCQKAQRSNRLKLLVVRGGDHTQLAKVLTIG